MQIVMSLILLLIWVLPVSSQISVSGGYGSLLYHSENDEPSVLEEGFKDNVYGTLNFSTKLQEHHLYQVGVSYDEIIERFYREYRDGSGELISRPYLGSFLEQSLTSYIRKFWTVNGFTGYGLGPLLGITRQTYVQNIADNPQHRELINIYHVGLSSVIRYGRMVRGQYYGFVELELKGGTSFHIEGGGQDFSDYSHRFVQLGISTGLGKLRE